MRLTTGTRTRILADLTFEFDPSAATVQLEIDGGDMVAATWAGPAVAQGGTWTRTAQSDGFYIAGPVDDPDGATVLALGRHNVTAHVLAAGESYVTPATVIDVVNALNAVTVGELRDRLTNAGGAGSRTAGELSDDRLAANLEEAIGETLGRLSRFTIAPGAVPPLLRSIILAIGAYLATLEYFGSQPLEDRDPMVLAYARAEKQLDQLARGVLVDPGITRPDEGSPSGEAAVFGGANMGLAEGWVSDLHNGGHPNMPPHYGGVTWG